MRLAVDTRCTRLKHPFHNTRCTATRALRRGQHHCDSGAKYLTVHLSMTLTSLQNGMRKTMLCKKAAAVDALLKSRVLYVLLATLMHPARQLLLRKWHSLKVFSSNIQSIRGPLLAEAAGVSQQQLLPIPRDLARSGSRGQAQAVFSRRRSCFATMGLHRYANIPLQLTSALLMPCSSRLYSTCHPLGHEHVVLSATSMASLLCL